MTRYTNVKMQISEDQKHKITEAFESNSKSITIRVTFPNLHGEDVIFLNQLTS